MIFYRAKFANSALLCCSNLISELLEDENNEAREKLQKDIGHHCFDIIRKKGAQEINDFRKAMIKDFTQIVQSDNPIIAMRKKLIRTIHSDILNRTFLLEKYADRRQELYEEFNNYLDNSEILNSDETASVLFFWSEAECCILRMLQMYYFEKVGKDDWFSRYSEAYEIYTTELFDLALAKKDKKDVSLYSVTFPAMKQQIEVFQKKLIGEVIV